jgi:hypothetical protein
MILFALAVPVAVFAAMDLRHNTVWLGAWLFVALSPDGRPLGGARLVGGARGRGPLRIGSRVLFMAGNLGGVLLVQAVMGCAYPPFAVLAIVSLLAVPLAARLPARGSTEQFTGAAPAIEISGSAP